LRAFAQGEGEDEKRRGREKRKGKGRTSDRIDVSQVQVNKLMNWLSKQLLAQTPIPHIEVELKLMLALPGGPGSRSNILFL